MPFFFSAHCRVIHKYKRYDCVFVETLSVASSMHIWQIPSSPVPMSLCGRHTNLGLPKLGYDTFIKAHAGKPVFPHRGRCCHCGRFCSFVAGLRGQLWIRIVGLGLIGQEGQEE